MEHNELLSKQNRLLAYLTQMPSKIIKFYDLDSIPEFVLHDLSHEACFNLSKAAYFVNNPDFDFLKGVAGYTKEEDQFDLGLVWEKPDSFIESMKTAVFNNKVRDIVDTSLQHHKQSEQEIVTNLAETLGINNHCYCSWDLKHGNRGVLIYQKADGSCDLDQYLNDGLHLLGFCPIH